MFAVRFVILLTRPFWCFSLEWLWYGTHALTVGHSWWNLQFVMELASWALVERVFRFFYESKSMSQICNTSSILTCMNGVSLALIVFIPLQKGRCSEPGAKAFDYNCQKLISTSQTFYLRNRPVIPNKKHKIPPFSWKVPSIAHS